VGNLVRPHLGIIPRPRPVSIRNSHPSLLTLLKSAAFPSVIAATISSWRPDSISLPGELIDWVTAVWTPSDLSCSLPPSPVPSRSSSRPCCLNPVRDCGHLFFLRGMNTWLTSGDSVLRRRTSGTPYRSATLDGSGLCWTGINLFMLLGCSVSLGTGLVG
jgi:hypothetical protein